MSNKPDLTKVTTDGLNKNMGRTATPVHSMSPSEAETHYKAFHNGKAQEAGLVAENAKGDAKKLGIASVLLGAGALALGATGAGAIVVAAPTLLMGAHKFDTWINKLDSKDIHETTARSHMFGDVRQLAAKQNIEIDDSAQKPTQPKSPRM